jgi:hypothetical protein
MQLPSRLILKWDFDVNLEKRLISKRNYWAGIILSTSKLHFYVSTHHPSRLYMSKAGTLLARAQPLVQSDPGYPDTSNVRQWRLFDNDIQLTIRRKPEDNQWHLRPELSLEGKVGYPVRLTFHFKLPSLCVCCHGFFLSFTSLNNASNCWMPRFMRGKA